MENNKGLIFNIQRYSIHDGPGIRTTVFMKGCPLRCIWCQNPEGQAPKSEILLNLEKCTGCGRCVLECPKNAIEIYKGKSHTNRQICDGCGRCAEVCPNEARNLAGRLMTAEEVFGEIIKDRIFYERSGGGVTLSGGDPLAQPDFAISILKLCKEAYIHTALDTCGYAEWKTFEEVLKFVDLLLYDFKNIDPIKHKKNTGVLNDLIINNAKKVCHKLSIPMWARIPIIPGYNDSQREIEDIAKFISVELGSCVQRVNLLPYHRLGEIKFERLEANYSLSTEPPDEGKLNEFKKIFESFRLPVYIGG